MFKNIAIVAAIAFASFASLSAQAQVSQKNQNGIIVHNDGKPVVAKKVAPKKNVVHAYYVADARINDQASARLIGRNYIGTESGIEGVDFNRK